MMTNNNHSVTKILLVGLVILVLGVPLCTAVTIPKLHYQGRLLDPANGAPKADGLYTMIFNVYTAPVGGSLLWTEIKSVTVTKGIFSTLLGDTTAFDPAIFNGQDLWLGMSVGADPEMTPRQPLAYVPYAIYADSAAHAASATTASTAINADKLDNLHSSSFSLSTHTHSILPQAFGYVARTEPYLRSGYNIDSVAWNTDYNRWEITLTGFYYSIDDIAVATTLGDATSCAAGTTIRTTSVDGKLLVYHVNSTGSKIKCSYHFVAFAGQ